jgi:hypothetical protein
MDPKYQELSKATSVAEILEVTRAYLSSWSVEELERLPDACRPGRVKSAEDIERWADVLSGQAVQTPLFLDDERKLDRMASHFLIASVRLRQLTETYA